MLKSLVQMASSWWTKGFLLVLWLLSLLFMVERGWVWESQEWLPDGGLLYRYKYWDIERTPLFVWLSLILLGYFAHLFRQRSLGYYGLVEILFGLVAGFLAVSKLALTDITAWFALAASAFVIVRGAGNVVQAVTNQETATTKAAK